MLFIVYEFEPMVYEFELVARGELPENHCNLLLPYPAFPVNTSRKSASKQRESLNS